MGQGTAEVLLKEYSRPKTSEEVHNLFDKRMPQGLLNLKSLTYSQSQAFLRAIAP